MLTHAQELQINSVEKYTHDFEVEAVKSFDATGDDMMEALQARFEADIAGTYDADDDLGGLSVYFNSGELIAFYDYENFKGVVFA